MRFRLLNGVLQFTPERCIKYILAGVVLHNYLRVSEIENNRPPPNIPENLDDEVRRLIARERVPPGPISARIYRDRYISYFALEL